MVEGGGFEPPKALPTDLQSVPFSHSGTPPKDLPEKGSFSLSLQIYFVKTYYWSWRWDLNPQPADYKSAALPVELRQLIKLKSIPRLTAFFKTFLNQLAVFLLFISKMHSYQLIIIDDHQDKGKPKQSIASAFPLCLRTS